MFNPGLGMVFSIWPAAETGQHGIYLLYRLWLKSNKFSCFVYILFIVIMGNML